MPININIISNVTTINYEEVHGSRRESWRGDGITAQRRLKCAWDDKHTLARELRGYLRNDGGGVSFMNPQSFPGFTNLFVADVDIEPFSPGPIASTIDTKILEYEFASLLVTYENIGNIATEDPVHGGTTDEPTNEVLITESFNPTVEFLTTSNRKLFWDSSPPQIEPLEIDEAPGIQVRMMEWIYTVHFMPFIPTDAIDLAGRSNNAPIPSPSLNKTFAEETLLYYGASPSRQITEQGIQAWEITYRFGYREKGWNNFPRAVAGGTFEFFPLFNSNGDQEIPYPPADLTSFLLA